METQSTVNLKKEALKNGAIWGAISIVIFLATWYIAPSIMASYVYSGISIAIGLSLAIFFCIDLRKKAGGYWSFSEALIKIFVMFLTSMAIVYIFTIVFGKYIDTSYPVKMKEMILAKTESALKSFGVADEDLEKGMQNASEKTDKQLSPNFSQAVVAFGISAVLYFIGALIFALIFKKEKPISFGPLTTED